MSQHHTFFGKLLAGILDVFKSSAQKLWEDLTPEEQQSLKDGSGIINVINNNIDKAPEVIQEELIKEFPDTDIPKLESELVLACNYLGLKLNGQTITDAIAALKEHLASKEGTVWQWASQAAAEIISVIKLPGLSVFAKIGMLAEYAYRTFVKK